MSGAKEQVSMEAVRGDLQRSLRLHAGTAAVVVALPFAAALGGFAALLGTTLLAATLALVGMVRAQAVIRQLQSAQNSPQRKTAVGA